MGAAFDVLKLYLFVSSFLYSCATAANEGGGGVGVFPAACEIIECPSYDVVASGNGFEIRRYNSSMWISTKPVEDISLVHAANIAFFQLFDYIQGKNEKHEKIEMTAPVMIQVGPSDGPLCASSFVVSFFIPIQNQPTAPASETLDIQKWGVTYAAVRQFGGFVRDDEVGVEAAALYTSLAGTVWSEAVDKSHGATSEYIVVQYNSPFEFRNRVNEIWFTFNYLDAASSSK